MNQNAPAPERIAARVSIIGEDTPIRRALPSRARRMVGAWCFLDHAGPVQFAPDDGLHVGAHPHIGLQTFTWMIEGELMHRDSLGNAQIIRPGQVNLMTAGRGIAHTEDSVNDGGRLHAAQLWIALPDGERFRAPAFDHYPQLPGKPLDGWQVTLLAGRALGLEAPTRIYSPMVGMDWTCEDAARAVLPLEAGFEYAAMVLRGQAHIGGELLTPGELLYFAPGGQSLEIASDAACQVLILGGEPFGEEILLWWNFVARSQAELQAALDDWESGSERFGKVHPGSRAAPLKAPALDGVRLKNA